MVRENNVEIKGMNICFGKLWLLETTQQILSDYCLTDILKFVNILSP